jgi:hypothetical protein
MSTPPSTPPSGELPYIPSNIPYDECRKFYDCEKHAQECPSYKEYVNSTPEVSAHAGTTSSGAASAAAQAQIKQLQQLAVCVEKFESKPAGGAQAAQKASKYQQAAFLLSTLWGVKDTIKISFMQPLPATYPGEQPQWDGQTLRPPTTRKVDPQAADSKDSQSCSATNECQKLGDFVCANGKCVPNLMPQWYTKDLVNINMKPGMKISAEDEELEKRVRAMDPVDAIQTIVRERIQPLIGLKLEFVDVDGDIRIGLDNTKGSWSMVGVQCKQVPAEEATMNFGWLDVATIIHEFCHALGMIHEHQNPFGKGIDWNLKKVFAWANSTQGWDMYTTCENITKRYNQDLVNGSDYDPESIMLYSYPADLTNNKQATYRNVSLSEFDKMWLSSIYPKDGKERTFPNRAQAARNAQSSAQAQQRNWMLIGASVLGVSALGLLLVRRWRRS